VQLQDVSVQDEPAKVIAEVNIPTAGKQVPVPFRIPYSPADINPRHSYVVRATIAAGEELKPAFSRIA
jgi:putative lipoprotein